MAAGQLELAVAIDAGPECDADERARLDRGLRAELVDLDVYGVTRAAGGSPPDGARSADALTVGGLVVALGASRHVLRAVVDTTIAWLAREQGRTAKLVLPGGETLDVSGVSSAQQRELVTQWVERHAPPE